MLATGFSGVRRSAVVGMLLCVLLGGGSAAHAALVARGGAVHGCVSRAGALRVIAAGRHHCPRGEQSLTFDQGGPRGSTGPAGSTGPQGAAADPNQLKALESRVSALELSISTLQSQNAALAGRAAALEGTLSGVSRTGSTLRFSGMNLQLLSGSGATDGPVNGLGNVIIGYNEDPVNQTGSHNLILGRDQTFTSFGGIDAGDGNRILGPYASVSGGTRNTASGQFSSVSGGENNQVTAASASDTGGQNNLVDGAHATVVGGLNNRASGIADALLGGYNQALALNSSCATDPAVGGPAC